jgi:transcriptional regulator with XRE-family HTH domain
MPLRKDPDASASVPAFYGAELRWKRDEAGMSLEQLADGSFFGIAYLSQIERAERRMPIELARHVDRVLNTDGFFERRCGDARKAKATGHAEYFADVAEMETRAETIEEWEPTLIPGLLQTEAYARMVIQATHPLEQPDAVKAKVDARLERAALFDDDLRRPRFWGVLSESVLCRPMLPPAEMAEQLDQIAELVKRRRIVLQVLPMNAGPHPFMIGTVTVMTFRDAPPVAYTESLHTGQLIDDYSLVRQYRESYDLLRAAALSPKASLAMIEAAAEDYRREAHRHD